MTRWFHRGVVGIIGVGIGAAVVLGACSDQRGPTGANGEGAGSDPTAAISGDQGGASVSLELQIAPGVYLYSLSYTCTGPTNVGPVAVNFGDAESIEWVVGGLAAGAGYQCQITARDTNGDQCSGATTVFSIVAGQVTQVGALITCALQREAGVLAADVNSGSLEVDASVALVQQGPQYQCPGITAFSITPAEVLDSQPAQLSVATTGTMGLAPDGGPTTSNIIWSATCATPPCGTFSPSTVAAAPTFVCGANVQQVTINVQITDFQTIMGVTSDVCAGQPFTTMQALVNCEHSCFNAPLGATCTFNGGSICNGAGTCVVPSFDVVRLGNGSAVTAGTTVPVFIDQYGLGGALLASTPLPTAVSGSNQPLTLVGSDVSEGDLTTSVDGKLLVLAGHNYVPGSGIGAANTGVAFIGAGTTPTVNTSLQLPLALSAGGIVRSAVSLDGTQVWVAGAGTTTTGGLWYMPGDVQVVRTTTTTTGRDVRIFGGQLYADSNANPPGLFTVGSGTPITGSPAPTLTELPGLPTSGGSPFAFVFLTVNGVQTLYIADDQGGGVGGILKFTLSGGTWHSAGHLQGIVSPGPDGGTVTVGYRGLAGYVTGTTVTLLASTGMAVGGQDALVLIVDTGSGTPSQTLVAASAPNETFRGIAVPPHP